MSDFAAYAPSVKSSAVDELIDTRLAVTTDVDALAAVMAARGGVAEEHVDRARTMIDKLDTLLIAEKDGKAVGWCGVWKHSIFAGAEPEFLVAGLTVTPEMRRQGIAARLLCEVLRATSRNAPGEPVFSVINARNLASIDLHRGLGFVEAGRSPNYAGIKFTGGEGVLLRRS